MDSLPVYVGLDYHSKSIQVCVMDMSGRVLANRRCGNSVMEVTQVVAPFGMPSLSAIEASCGAADMAEDLIAHTGWSVTLAHPGYVSRMRGNPDKTDYSDARMLADLCRAGMVPRVWLAPAYIRELRVLVRFRFDQVRRRTAVKMRVAAVLREQRIVEPCVGRWTKRWLSWLDQASSVSEQGRWVIRQHLTELGTIDAHVRAVEGQISAFVTQDPVVTRLLSIRGIGPVTAWTMRAIIGRFDRFSNGKQLARFCALTPNNRSSGQRQADAGLIRAGDPALKCVLVQAAQRLRRHEPRWRELYERLRENGKPVCLATAAIANRWVRSLHHQLTEVRAA